MKSRRYFLIQGALAATAMLVVKPFMKFAGKKSILSSGQGNGNSITLLHTNDLHNQLGPVSHDIYSGMGGFEKTAGIISRIKNENNNVVLVDAGDIFCGNIRHQKEHEATLRMMQGLKYDAALLGNRDYEAGTDYLQEQWGNNPISLVASNYSFRDSWLKDLHQPYKIVQKGNIKIGIIGAGIDMKGLVASTVSDNVRHKDPVKYLTAVATMLKQDKKCQLVICLSHLGYRNKNRMDDLTLAVQSKNIDVIIGAHSHTFMSAPVIAMNREQHEVIINHAGYGGIVLGNMNISFDDDGNKSKVDFNNLMVGNANNKWIHQKSPVSIS